MENKKNKKNKLLLIVLSFGFVMAALDATGAILAVPEIKKVFTISIQESIWIVNSYTLALGTFLLIAGNLSSKYGAKKILIIGMMMFIFASFGCSISGNIKILICCRFFQGVGAALFMPSSMSLLFMSYPNTEKRSKMLGIWSSIISVATGTGSFIGGVIIQYFGWRSFFLINIPLGFLTILFIVLTIKEDIKRPEIKIGYLSHFLLVMSISSIIIFLVEGNQYGYTKNHIFIYLIAFISFGIIFVLREDKVTQPIIPKVLLKKYNFIMANLLGLIINMSLYGIVLILGMYFQIQLSLSPMVSGLLIFPGMIVLVIGNLIFARYSIKIKSSRWLVISVSMALLATCTLYLLSLILNPLPVFVIIVIISIMNLGVGVLIPATTSILMESSGMKYSGIAGAVLNANKQIGGLFGMAIGGIIIYNNDNSWNNIIQTTFLLNIAFYFVGLILAKKVVPRINN